VTKLSIVTGVCGRNEITRRWIDNTIANCAEPHELVIVSNGSSTEENAELRQWLSELKEKGWVTVLLESDKPLGSTVALNVGVKNTSGEIIAMIHNDLLIKDQGWDKTLLDFYDNTPNVGLVGFAGAKQLGAPDIYKVPYVLTQLGRAYVYTSLEDHHVHGDQTTEPTNVLVLDGLTMCCRRSDFIRLGGFDESYIHHMYDNDLSLTFAYDELNNYVIPITCQHLNGQTANFGEYNTWLREEKKKDGDAEIHRISHEIFYEKWRGKLPVRVQ
jgi:O-antigen biosynthesis protein